MTRDMVTGRRKKSYNPLNKKFVKQEELEDYMLSEPEEDEE